MPETNEASHPTLKQFKSALDTRKVGRDLMSAFDRFRNNPDKCAADSELKVAADALWARFQTEMGGQPAAPSSSGQNHVPKPGPDARKGGRGGDGGRGRGGPGGR